MSYLLKDPGAVLDYVVDWGVDYLAAGETLAASDWTVIPDEPDGIGVAGSDFNETTATVSARNGVAGHVYRLVNRITTSLERIDERSIVMRVENR